MFKSGIAILLFLLAITLIILGSIVMGSADKTDETSKNNTKRSGTGVLIIGIIFLLATIIPIFHLFKGISYSPSGAFFYF
jgi:succinate dehydrogenase/fumarate reductase cytochrome b subunit